MSDRIISPDGKFMWTGSEWIPVPPPETPPMIDFEAQLRLGDAARKKGNWTLALEHWNRIIEGDGRQIDAEILINAMLKVAGFYIAFQSGTDWLKNSEMANKILNEALYHSRKNSNKKLEVFTLMKLSDRYFRMSQKIDDAYQHATDEIYETMDIVLTLYSPKHSWEKDYVDCIEKTVNFLDSAILVAKELSDSELQALVICDKSLKLTGLIKGFDYPLGNQLPRFLLWEQNILLANIQSDIQFVLDVVTMQSNMELECKAYEVLTKVYLLLGDRNEARRYFEMRNEVYDSIPHEKRDFPTGLILGL